MLPTSTVVRLNGRSTFKLSTTIAILKFVVSSLNLILSVPKSTNPSYLSHQGCCSANLSILISLLFVLSNLIMTLLELQRLSLHVAVWRFIGWQNDVLCH